MSILAIDGALNHSGWVILSSDGRAGKEGIELIDFGIIAPKLKWSLACKLIYIRQELITVFQKYNPEMIIFEDTYAGSNAMVTARLNNVKGVILMTAFELLDDEPICVRSSIARSCLGFKSGKDPKRGPWEFFTKQYGLEFSFEKGNDITDACTLGWWHILAGRGECEEKAVKKKANDN